MFRSVYGSLPLRPAFGPCANISVTDGTHDSPLAFYDGCIRGARSQDSSMVTLIQTLVAGLGLLVCVTLLVRMSLSARRRARLDAAFQRLSSRSGAAWRTLLTAWRSRGEQREARRLADEVIRRARDRSADEWDGNVVRPKEFHKDRKH